LVSLHRLEALRGVEHDETAGQVRIGAMTTLAQVQQDPLVREHFPSLAQAAGLVASPQIRNAGTIGGNIHLPPRCVYVNQSEFWRGALGGCLRTKGPVCHVVEKGRRCVAAMSSDCVPVLHSLDAELVLRSKKGERRVAVADYFRADGTHHTERADDELMTEVRIPTPNTPRRSAYVKWSLRKSIDFPLVSLALRFDLSADAADAPITGGTFVVGALGAKPKALWDAALLGRRLSAPGVADEVGEFIRSRCKPLTNLSYDADHRRHMLGVLARRAVASLGQ
jgi:4-hydroxybenzoyl-CoA reductase subunit beta